jgi:hypothetical protein
MRPDNIRGGIGSKRGREGGGSKRGSSNSLTASVGGAISAHANLLKSDLQLYIWRGCITVHRASFLHARLKIFLNLSIEPEAIFNLTQVLLAFELLTTFIFRFDSFFLFIF